jgi:hypothetical protein
MHGYIIEPCSDGLREERKVASLNTEIFMWYLNYKRWCDERGFAPESYSEWLERKLDSQLLWAD